MDMLITGAVGLLNAYQLMIFVYIILKWFPEFRNNKISEILSSLVEPFLSIFRNVIPPIAGLDLSVMVAMILLQLAAVGLASW